MPRSVSTRTRRHLRCEREQAAGCRGCRGVSPRLGSHFPLPGPGFPVLVVGVMLLVVSIATRVFTKENPGQSP